MNTVIDEAGADWRVLVTASRNWTDAQPIREALGEAFRERPNKRRGITVVHGGARGGDRIAVRWVRDFSCAGIPIQAEEHLAEWELYGRAAGHIRNAAMVKANIDLCLAFIRDNSPGATGCAAMAEKAGIQTVIHRWSEESE